MALFYHCAGDRNSRERFRKIAAGSVVSVTIAGRLDRTVFDGLPRGIAVAVPFFVVEGLANRDASDSETKLNP